MRISVATPSGVVSDHPGSQPRSSSAIGSRERSAVGRRASTQDRATVTITCRSVENQVPRWIPRSGDSTDRRRGQHWSMTAQHRAEQPDQHRKRTQRWQTPRRRPESEYEHQDDAPAPAAIQASARAAAATDGLSEDLLQDLDRHTHPPTVRSAPEPRFSSTRLIANLRKILRAVADRAAANRIVSTTRGPEMPYVAWTHHGAYSSATDKPSDRVGRLPAANTEQIGDRIHRRPPRLMIVSDLGEHPDRPLLQLRRMPSEVTYLLT